MRDDVESFTKVENCYIYLGFLVMMTHQIVHGQNWLCLTGVTFSEAMLKCGQDSVLVEMFSHMTTDYMFQ